jgi:hypothetical protein
MEETSVAASFHRPPACVHVSSSGYDYTGKFLSPLLGCDSQYSNTQLLTTVAMMSHSSQRQNAIPIERGFTSYRDGNVAFVSMQQATDEEPF